MASQDSNHMLRTLTEKSLAGIYLVQDGKFCFINSNAASYGYYNKEELIGVKSDSVIHPEDRAMVKANARAMLRGERQAPYGFRIIAKNGQTRWIMETVTPFSFEGKPALLGNSMDITDRMEAEERLRESEILYRTIFETTGTATMIVEENTTVTLVNTEFEQLSGASKDYWEGKRSWTEFVHEKDRDRMLGYHYARRIDPDSAPRNYEFSLFDKKGNIREVLITISMIPGTKKSVASFAEITERRKAEERLRESEILYRTIFETTGTATIIVEEDTTVTLVNTEFEQLSGAPKDYWEGKRSWTEFVHEKDRDRMLGYHYARRIDPDSAPRNYEFSLLDKQGNVREVLITISMIPGTKRSVASFAEITKRRKAEERLRESEILYRTLFETTGTATIIIEEDTTISLVNTQFEQLSGAPKDYWEGKRSWTDFAHEKDRERMMKYHLKRRVDPDSAPRNYEFSFVDRQGNVREVIITTSMIPGTKKSLASFADITEREKTEESLRKREKELKDKTNELEELNAALRVLLKSREEDKIELENTVMSGLNKLVMPYIEKMRKGHLKGNELVCLNVIESNLKDITSPFMHKLSSQFLNFTPRELQVTNLINEGKTTKEIADFMNVSLATVEIHRHHIREKLGLTKKKTNLRTYLTSLK
ncbi:MAG: hypothetical protein CSYNP_00276 [Syntrophus sp. SKADARSKE-3]|nr:hypothetical protein [Syntrophus sp. SKADARSKE-3]